MNKPNQTKTCTCKEHSSVCQRRTCKGNEIGKGDQLH